MSLADRARQRRAEMGLAPEPESPPQKKWDDDLIPDVEKATYAPTQEDIEVDRLIDGIDIATAYQRWCGKSEPKLSGRRESVMVSCPNPDHPDKNPSAWMNLDKDVFACGACGVRGGDKFDIAAWRFGHSVPGYKTDGSFPELRRKMAEDLGYRVVRTSTGRQVATAAPPSPTSAGDDDAEGDQQEPATLALAPVVALPVPKLTSEPPTINWPYVVNPESFLGRWMDVCSKDDLPEEFYFWLGLLAVGFAAGDDAVLEDNPLVKGNLFVCLFGPTGIGKSRATRALEQVLGAALPYDPDDPVSTGICQIAQPGSAESLLDNFSKPQYDPTDPKKVVNYSQVRGLLSVDELSDIMGKAQRSGSVIKPMLMRLYDGYGNVTHRSRGYGFVRAERPFCSTVTTTQPKAIRELLVQTDADSGFVNRWIFAAGAPKKLVPIGREPLDIESTVRLLQGLRTWCSSSRRIALGTEAKAMWSEFFGDVIEPLKLDGSSALMTRVDLTLKKIMLLLSVDEKDVMVTKERMERVLDLWPYLRDTYDALSDEIGVGPFEECRRAVVDTIREWEQTHNSGIDSKTLSRALGGRFDRELVLRALKNLEQMKEIREFVSPGVKKGQEKTLYKFVS